MSRLDLSVLGTTGLRESGGWIYEEFLRRLQGQEGVKYYREMSDNSSVIGALLFAIKSLILSAEWRIEPANDTPEAKAEGEFVEGALEDMSHTWDEFLGEVLTMLSYGWAYFEVVWKLRRGERKDPRFRSTHDDGRWGWRKFSLRGQDTLWKWELERDGGIRGMWQYDSYSTGGGNVFIPIEKALLFRTSVHKNNPEGRSLLRNAALDWHYLKRIQQIEAVGIERDLAGIPTIWMPLEYLQANPKPELVAVRDRMFREMAQVKRDEREFIAMPSKVDSDGKPTGWDFTLMSTGGRRQFDTNAISNRYSRSMLMSVMAEVLMLGTETGSWSLASSKTRMLSMGIGSLMDAIASVFNRFAIPPLMTANGVPTELHPYMVHGDVETPELGEFGQFLGVLPALGIELDEAQQRKVLERAKLPASVEDPGLPGEHDQAHTPQQEPEAEPKGEPTQKAALAVVGE